MGAPAVIARDPTRTRACSSLAFVAFVLYAVAGTLGSYVYGFYPDTMLLWTEVFLLVASILAVVFGGYVLYSGYDTPSEPEEAAVVEETEEEPESDLPPLSMLAPPS